MVACYKQTGGQALEQECCFGSCAKALHTSLNGKREFEGRYRFLRLRCLALSQRLAHTLTTLKKERKEVEQGSDSFDLLFVMQWLFAS